MNNLQRIKKKIAESKGNIYAYKIPRVDFQKAKILLLHLKEHEKHIQQAVSLLPDILNPIVYGEGDKNNIFRVQDMGIFSVDEIKSSIENMI